MKGSIFVEALRELKQRFAVLTESLSALQEISSIDIGDHEPEQVAAQALEILMEYEHLDGCCMFRVDGDTLVRIASLHWRDRPDAAPGEPDRSRNGALFTVGEGWAQIAARTGEIQHCQDCRTDIRFVSGLRGDMTLTGSLIAIPILMGAQVFAVLNVYHGRPGFFTQEHERLLNIFVKVLAQLLVSSRHVRRMEELVRERTRELERALAEARELRDRYEQLSVVDELTELHNRRFFFPEAEAALARAFRARRPLCLMLLDLDHFKLVNDSLGHAAGDRLLRSLARLLKAESRAGDILARVGGEEFAILLPDTDIEEARRFGNRLREHVKGLVAQSHGQQLAVTASAGIAQLDGSMAGSRDPRAVLEALLKQADQALYRAKTDGRDRVAMALQVVPPQSVS